MNRRSRNAGFAVVLLMVGLARHFLWAYAPPGVAGVASKGLGAAAAFFLLLTVIIMWRSWFVAAAGGWYAFEELQTAVASAWYLIEPWPVPPGVPMLSAKAGWDIGAVTILVAALILVALNRAIWREQTNKVSG